MVEWWLAVFTTLSALGLGYFWHTHVAEVCRKSGEKSAEEVIQEATREAEIIKREAEAGAQEHRNRVRDEFDTQTRERRKELDKLEGRYARREENLDRKVSMLEKKEKGIDRRVDELEAEKESLEALRENLDRKIAEGQLRIQQAAEMSPTEAREIILGELREELQADCTSLVRHLQAEARQTAEQQARKIITHAIERYAADTVSDITTCSVSLPSDEMKGRIIGKEGRNIRSIEAETGVNIMIDDTPEVVVLSGYDPLRREVARISLERLIADGRIHPARIEEIVAKVRDELDETVRKAGEAAIYEVGLRGVAPEIVRTLGRLKFRHSYSQNVLNHSVEMAFLMSSMASELGLNTETAKRIGLFHDIGKALTHEVEGSHALIGADILRKQGEDPLIVNAVAAHHGDVEGESIFANLAVAADAITAARPGARSENTQLYIQRLQALEGIANSYQGVVQTYAIQAGRELRVIVEPQKIDDNEAMHLARNISHQIAEEVNFPGQVKVTVIRETRSIEYAR